MFLKAAERGGFEVAGLELSPEGSRFARERLGLDVREERAEQMSFPPASFDVAVMFDVIEHLFDPRAVLHATGRALRPGGILLVGTPNLNAFSRFALGRDWAVLSPLEHTYYFTAATLRALLHSCGYSPVTFAREYPGLDPAATMNFRYTHAPHGWRSRVYGLFVRTAGTMLHPVIQAAGLGDALLAIARTTPQAGAAG